MRLKVEFAEYNIIWHWPFKDKAFKFSFLEQKKNIAFLFSQYLSNQISQSEMKLLCDYFAIDENEEILKQLIADELYDIDNTDNSDDTETKPLVDQIFQNIQKNKKK